MSDTLGQILIHARQKMGTSLEDASQATHIRLRFLQALEADDFAALPSVVQGRGFLRLYAAYLGLDQQALLELAPGQKPAPEPAVVASSATPPAETALPQPKEPHSSPDEILTPADGPGLGAEPSPPEIQIEHVGKPPSFLVRSQRIFEDVGRDLRAQRELLSLSLNDIERHTKLRVHYLNALEEGRMQDMPSFVQARGMLANYAHFLNLDSDTYLLRFADALQARREELAASQEVTRKPSTSRMPSHPTLKRFLSLDLLVTGGLIVLLFVFIAWGASRVLTLKAAQVVTATAPPVVDVLLPTATNPLIEALAGTGTITPASSSKPAVEASPTLSISIPTGAAPAGAVQISVLAVQRAWLSIIVDGKEQFNNIAAPGDTFTFSGNRQIEFLAGSASAFQVYFMDQDMGVLGNVGQVVDLIFTPQGIANPTPTIAPTATRTPPVTQTPPGKPKVTNTP